MKIGRCPARDSLSSAGQRHNVPVLLLDLTTPRRGLQYRQFPAFFRLLGRERKTGFMTPFSPSPVPEKRSPMDACKHPRVQIVAREEDAEFVECLECGEIFDSSEFKDMNIEETKLGNEPQ